MLMKYFAKFLPTEGTMEHATGLNQAEIGEIIDLKNRGFYKYLVEGKFQKMGLFLCSRDIKVGDEILIIKHSTSSEVLDKRIVEGYKEEFDAFRIKDGGYIGRSISIKPIGEISKDAIWVKEGDEFEDDEINKQFYDDSGSEDSEWFNWCPLHTEEDWRETPENWKRIQIKCLTCKNFH